MEEKKNYCKINENIVIIFLHVLKDSENRKCFVRNYLEKKINTRRGSEYQ